MRSSYWTNREATSTHEVPARLIVVGAGPVGCELAQAFSRMGSQVTIVDVGERLAGPRPPRRRSAARRRAHRRGGEAAAGAEARHGSSRACAYGSRDGTSIEADRLLVAAGPAGERRGARLRDARRDDLGPGDRGGRADARGRGRVGGGRRHRDRHVHPRRQVPGPARRGRRWPGTTVRADYRAVPAVTFTDPQVASVGDTSGEGAVMGERGSTARPLDLRAPAPDGVPEGVRRSASGGCWWARSPSAPRRASGSAS